MIINKSRIFCSILRKSMWSLDQFQFSNVKSTTSNTVSTRNSKKTSSKIIEESDQERPCQTINFPIKRQKTKSKKLIVNPTQTFYKIQQWRKNNIAPVDTMGCERLSQTTQAQEIQKYQTLIFLMLSIQTTDQITSMVVKRLQQYGLTPIKIAQTPQNKLVQLIYQSNFNKRKAKNIIEVSKLVVLNGLPKNKQALLKLPGIGIKIAMIYLRVAEGILDGIGVDTHVHRISNKLGWVDTSNPNQTQQKLQNIFPKKYWTELNISLVGFGQLICNAKKPLCQLCPVKLQCPSSLVKQNSLQW